MGQNLVEKIAQRYAVDLEEGHVVHAGDYLSMRPAHVMTHDNTAAVIAKFRRMGVARVFDASQPVFALDHDIQNRSRENLEKYRQIEAFAREQGIRFFPAGRGIGHQIMVEEGFVLPGSFVVGSDSHSNLYGALGALGTPVVRTDAAAIWATGRTWWQLPDVVRVHLRGTPEPGVSGKDVILSLIGVFREDPVLNCCIEFTGDGVAALGIEQRLTIANMTTEWGALAGVFPYDRITRTYLAQRAARHGRDAGLDAPPMDLDQLERDLPQADVDAFYCRELEFDLSAVTPLVAGPNEVQALVSLGELDSQAVRIHKAFLLSCVNGRVEDFEAAARVLRGKRIADGVQLFIAAASSEVEEAARRTGAWNTLLEAGALPLPPGCGPCIGLGEGVLADGEVAISATNRNFKGRMGSPKATVYLASPAVVAASAASGTITGPPGTAVAGPAWRAALEARSDSRRAPHVPEPAAETAILPGFPPFLAGELLYVPKNNMNTDGIYGKDWTYREGMSKQEMGSKALLNYDPRFQEIVRDGDILVGGSNFGTGSSREQAATALAYRGLQMVIAASFSQTYKRNAFNNGFILVECPELVEALAHAFAEEKALSFRTGWMATVDFTKARIECEDRSFGFRPLGRVAQELVAHGGFEQVIQEQIALSGSRTSTKRKEPRHA